MPTNGPTRTAGFTTLLYAGFFLTGVAVGSFGAMLPLLLPRLHLNDAGGGMLLFAFFASSSLGSLLARGTLQLPFGCSGGLIALATYALARLPWVPPLLSTAGYGLGLGVCITCVSLQQSRAEAHRRVAEFARLNLIWAAGALAGPALCLRLARRVTPAPVLLTLACAFLLLAVYTVVFPRELWSAAPSHAPRTKRAVWRTIWPLLFIIPIATGLEGAAGGWLTTYADRYGLHLLGGLSLPLLFWAGLLLCRLAYSTRWFPFRDRTTLVTLACFTAIGTGMLAASHRSTLLLLGAALLGWGLGSLYPVTLATLFATTELGNAAFLIAGMGGALLPLLAGLVSNHFHSLRAGMLFLLLPASALLMTALYCATQSSDGVANSPAIEMSGQSNVTTS